MTLDRSMRTCAVAAAIVLSPLMLCQAAAAQSRLEYLEQERQVQAETSHQPDEPELAERVVARDFAPFRAEAESYLFDPWDLDSARARVTQNSRLDPLAITSSGSLSFDINGEFGRGHSHLLTYFEVVGAPAPYTLRYDITTAAREASRDPTFRAYVLLDPFDPPGERIVPPTEIELFPNDADARPTEVHFVQSGVLQPGTYELQFDVQAFSVSYDYDYSATYAFALTIPEPSAACALAAMTAAALLRRRRRPRCG